MSWNAVVFRPHFLTRLASLCSKGALEVDADAAGPCELACERVRRLLQSSFFKMLLCMIEQPNPNWNAYFVLGLHSFLCTLESVEIPAEPPL